MGIRRKPSEHKRPMNYRLCEIMKTNGNGAESCVIVVVADADADADVPATKIFEDFSPTSSRL